MFPPPLQSSGAGWAELFLLFLSSWYVSSSSTECTSGVMGLLLQLDVACRTAALCCGSWWGRPSLTVLTLAAGTWRRCWRPALSLAHPPPPQPLQLGALAGARLVGRARRGAGGQGAGCGGGWWACAAPGQWQQLAVVLSVAWLVGGHSEAVERCC